MWILGIGLVSVVSIGAGLVFGRLLARSAEENTFDPRLAHLSNDPLRPRMEPAVGQVSDQFADRTAASAHSGSNRVAARGNRLENQPEQVRVTSHLNN